MPRRLPACLALALFVTAIPVAHAQLGGIVKKKATEKITGKKDTVAVAGTTAKPKCDASRMVIDAGVVDRYLKGAAAWDAMEVKLAKEPGPTGAYYTAIFKRRALEKRKLEFDLRRGPDWQRFEALQKRIMEGDTTAIPAYSTFHQTIDPNSVQIPQLAWEDQQKTNAKVDSTMKVTGKFSDCDWLDLGERLPRLVGTVIDDPNAKDFQGWGTASEAAAVKSRIVELGRVMGYKDESAEVKARRAELARQDSAKAAAGPSTGNAQVDCIAKAHIAYTKAHKKELDAAQETQDMTTIMRLSMEMNAEAQQKCPSE